MSAKHNKTDKKMGQLHTIATRALPALAAATLAACGSWAPKAMPENPNDPAQALYNARKAMYACLDAKASDCSTERARVIEATRVAEDADIRRVRQLGGSSFKVGGM
ncbi:hypothetical protein CURE108131_25195 [Cupriavidus respiraculi]|uniref:Lipoprotein n=1 Tax=Cupriavidus respiraculi TaxID=195930 RepID=A0ABN7ZJ94_9BURK|nr:hypothetical protein [Cupriavidus respiraculi]CAG9184330.1 hypothetical protein LMG21510_05070 [Cupriavidus respiraculi]